jgi:phosphate/sulfate permease
MAKSLAVLLALMVILTGLLMPGDSLATTTDTSIPDNEMTNSTNHSATMTITMTTPPLTEE